MNAEHVRVQLNNALDLLQLIGEVIEDFSSGTADSAVKARAGMSLSALYVLESYLRDVREGVAGNER